MKNYVNLRSIAILLLLITTVLSMQYNGILDNTQHSVLDSPILKAVNHRGNSSSAVYIGNGYVLTSAHGLGDQTTLTLTTESGAHIESEHLWSAQSYDIALFRVDTDLNINNYTLDCTPLYLGEPLMFVGNPLNLTNITVIGTVAGRPLVNMTETWSHLIPVDAPIIPGMSGGAVIDTVGNLRGINVGTMVLDQGFAFTFTGISYIVPSDAICMLLGRT